MAGIQIGDQGASPESWWEARLQGGCPSWLRLTAEEPDDI